MLISAMEECARGSIDFKKIKQLVPGVGKDQSYTVAEDQAAKFNQAACNFIFKGLLTVSDQASDGYSASRNVLDDCCSHNLQGHKPTGFCSGS